MHTWPDMTGDPCFCAFSPCFPWVGCKPQVAGAYPYWFGTEVLCCNQMKLSMNVIGHMFAHTFLLKTAIPCGMIKSALPGSLTTYLQAKYIDVHFLLLLLTLGL